MVVEAFLLPYFRFCILHSCSLACSLSSPLYLTRPNLLNFSLHFDVQKLKKRAACFILLIEERVFFFQVSFMYNREKKKPNKHERNNKMSWKPNKHKKCSLFDKVNPFLYKFVWSVRFFVKIFRLSLSLSRKIQIQNCSSSVDEAEKTAKYKMWKKRCTNKTAITGRLQYTYILFMIRLICD